MVDQVNNSQNISALLRPQATTAAAAKSNRQTAPVTLNQQPVAKSAKTGITLAGTSVNTNLPRGSIVDKLV